MTELSSLPHHLRHLARSQYYESKKKGEHNDSALLVMGLVSVFLGAAMSYRAWERLQNQGNSKRFR